MSDWKEECKEYKIKKADLEDGEFDAEVKPKKKKKKPKKADHKHEYVNAVIRNDHDFVVKKVCMKCGKVFPKLKTTGEDGKALIKWMNIHNIYTVGITFGVRLEGSFKVFYDHMVEIGAPIFTVEDKSIYDIKFVELED